MSIVVWFFFIVFILGMLAIDLGFVNRKSHVPTAAEALRFSGICVLCALVFNVLVFFLYDYRLLGMGSKLGGMEAAQQFLTGWLIEQSLSLDNIFVFAMIFSYFAIPRQYQHRVLFWGILGALVMRAVMILIGAELLEAFWWAEYLFGLLLLYAACKMMFFSEGSFNPEHNIFFRFARRAYPISHTLDGERFFTHLPDGTKAATPLFLVLLVIESTDVLFAVDSIPAVFAITRDPFIVFSSNVFAILNLRSLYFALAAVIERFSRIKIALVLVLIFVAIKLLIKDFYHFPTWISLSVIMLLLGAGFAASFLFPEAKNSESTHN